ncbi:MAG: hypothetical protein Q8O38_09095 [Sulfurimicrobium sp.]|nr:hypothetical protein [Sulfurimicrobium sp.]
MNVWNAEFAVDLLAKRGLYCHYHKAKAACFRIKGAQPRELSIALARKGVVTTYVNLRSVSGELFPENGIEGIDVVERYMRGHKGLQENPGISGSVARNNPSLNPASHDVLRVHVLDEASIEKLLKWYEA